ncbi:MAG: WhiB family transcriptional regulator [Actinobacteria bacterium]|nr:WhiB family transcriptional regulator [Actinomycetota bacterium]
MTETASRSTAASAVTSTDLTTVAAPVELGEDKSWQDLANCLGVDPDLFFPERGASTREAKEVCRGCVVRDDCLEYALANGEKFGIWGGMSERERRRIRRQRALARAAAASARTTATA